jgi:DNA invertase Pin-like site-specific DNA recombinase
LGPAGPPDLLVRVPPAPLPRRTRRGPRLGWSCGPPSASAARSGQGSRDRSAADGGCCINATLDPLGRHLRVAQYARVSTRDKDQDPELQLDALRAYVDARGWEAIEYVDQAAAGDLAHRTAWTRLLADVAQRKVDLVMVWKLDRAFRSTLHALATLRDLEHAGVGFSSLTQPELDTTSATGRLVFTILAAVAEMERELIADRVREGMRHAARQGKRIGRPPVTVRPAFARRWPAVRAEVAAGRLSRRQAARHLGIGTATLARLLAADTPSASGGAPDAA